MMEGEEELMEAEDISHATSTASAVPYVMETPADQPVPTLHTTHSNSVSSFTSLESDIDTPGLLDVPLSDDNSPVTTMPDGENDEPVPVCVPPTSAVTDSNDATNVDSSNYSGSMTRQDSLDLILSMQPATAAAEVDFLFVANTTTEEAMKVEASGSGISDEHNDKRSDLSSNRQDSFLELLNEASPSTHSRPATADSVMDDNDQEEQIDPLISTNSLITHQSASERRTAQQLLGIAATRFRHRGASAAMDTSSHATEDLLLTPATHETEEPHHDTTASDNGTSADSTSTPPELSPNVPPSPSTLAANKATAVAAAAATAVSAAAAAAAASRFGGTIASRFRVVAPKEPHPDQEQDAPNPHAKAALAPAAASSLLHTGGDMMTAGQHAAGALFHRFRGVRAGPTPATVAGEPTSSTATAPTTTSAPTSTPSLELVANETLVPEPETPGLSSDGTMGKETLSSLSLPTLQHPVALPPAAVTLVPLPIDVSTAKDAHTKPADWGGWSTIPLVGLEVQYPFSEWIVEGKKSVDVRRYDLPKALWNKPLVLLETGGPGSSGKVTAAKSSLGNIIQGRESVGRKIKIVGWCYVSSVIRYTSGSQFRKDQVRHCVSNDSEYGWMDGYTKELFGWVIDRLGTFGIEEIPIDFMVRRMRSLFEMGLANDVADKVKLYLGSGPQVEVNDVKEVEGVASRDEDTLKVNVIDLQSTKDAEAVNGEASVSLLVVNEPPAVATQQVVDCTESLVLPQEVKEEPSIAFNDDAMHSEENTMELGRVNDDSSHGEGVAPIGEVLLEKHSPPPEIHPTNNDSNESELRTSSLERSASVETTESPVQQAEVPAAETDQQSESTDNRTSTPTQCGLFEADKTQTSNPSHEIQDPVHDVSTQSTITSNPASSSTKLLDDLEKARATIESLSQSNTLLSHKYQELRAEMDSQTGLLVELQSSFSKQLEQCGELSHEKKTLTEKLKLAELSGANEKEAHRQTQEELDLERAKHVSEAEAWTLERQRTHHEISKLKEKLLELESREASAIARLNESKKQEATKSREVIALESELTELKPKYSAAKAELERVNAERDHFSSTMEKLKAKCVERVKKAEEALEKELELNEERKKKMKEYVTAKADELRNAKDVTAALTQELGEMRTNYKSVRDQLQDALVSAKAKDDDLGRMRREFERMKADSEKLHRMGNSLESQLSKTARETVEHKNKRLEAKQELMSMLRKLEAEQKVSKELKESIKFTFTPKALSQQQLLNEGVESLESALLRLARRLGKPLPPKTGQSDQSRHESTEGDEVLPVVDDGARGSLTNGSSPNRDRRNKSGQSALGSGKLEWDSSRLIEGLDEETQHVSQTIMTLMASVDRIHTLLDDPVGERTCISTLADILAGRTSNSTGVNDNEFHAHHGARSSVDMNNPWRSYGRLPNA